VLDNNKISFYQKEIINKPIMEKGSKEYHANLKAITKGRVQHTNNNASNIMHNSVQFRSLNIVLTGQ
jgi:hypothetical protein